MKRIYNVMVALLILLSISGLGAAAVTISGLANVSTADTTPTITFTVSTDDATNDSDMWLATLLIDGVDYGTVTASNATETSITADTAIASGFLGTYNVSAYNTTGGTHYSTTYTLATSNFAGVVSVIGDVVPIFTPIVDLIIAAGTVMIAIAMIAFVMGIMLTLFGGVSAAMKRMGK